MAIDFTLDDSLLELRDGVRDFISEIVIPAEKQEDPHAHGLSVELLGQLSNAARERSIYAPTAPIEFGGLGLDHRSQAVILEESGRSLLGPPAMNCAAPDEGNILLLHKVATAKQKEQYLRPLCLGQVRSAFAMTEPSPGAGADPNMLRTTAEPTADGWVINGLKWFTTGAQGAAFLIVMARTAEGATMLFVDGNNPGVRLVRTIGTLDSSFTGGHCEVLFENCLVSSDAVLGAVNEGFHYAQVRLGPARLTHCMRWLGAARRAHETAVGYAAGRPMFGDHLASLGMAQQMIADNEIDIAASRALIWQAAWALDIGRPARQETSVAKTFVAEATFRIVDRSLQLCGGLGVTDDAPVARIFREIRPFRIYDGPSEVHRWSIARRSVRHLKAGKLPGDLQ